MSVDWKVMIVKTQDLEKTLNWFEHNCYTINRYDPIVENYEGHLWIVIGYKGDPAHSDREAYNSVEN
jgi:hypothetical protein